VSGARLLQPALLLAILAMVAAPALTPAFTGYDPATFPVRIERPAIQPAGYAFSIWGLIYLWLLAHAVFGLLKRRNDPAFLRPALPLLVSGLLGSVWLAIASSAPITATFVILVMGGLAMLAYLRADQSQDRWLLAAPLAIYAGWLTAACGVSVGVILAGYGVLSNTGAALVMLAVVIAVALFVQARRPGMPVYGATVVWAAVGVVLANWADTQTVALTAAGGAVIVALWTLITLRRA
jgi:hypothetical protein